MGCTNDQHDVLSMCVDTSLDPRCNSSVKCENINYVVQDKARARRVAFALMIPYLDTFLHWRVRVGLNEIVGVLPEGQAQHVVHDVLGFHGILGSEQILDDRGTQRSTRHLEE